MASPRFAAVENPLANRFLLILPVSGQKVKGVSPSSLEVLLGSREEKPAGPTDRTVLPPVLGMMWIQPVEKLQSLCGVDTGA